jgi:hypothetical protein
MDEDSKSRPGMEFIAEIPSGTSIKFWGDYVWIAHPDHPMRRIRPDGVIEEVPSGTVVRFTCAGASIAEPGKPFRETEVTDSSGCVYAGLGIPAPKDGEVRHDGGNVYVWAENLNTWIQTRYAEDG